MAEDPDIIGANVTRYREVLKRDLDDEKRAAIKQLLAKALEQLNSRPESKK